MAATEAVAASPWVVAAAVGFGLYIGYGLGQVDKDSNFSGDGSLWERICPQVLVSGLQKIGIHFIAKSMDTTRPTRAVEESTAVESNESSVGISRPQSPPARPNAPFRSTAKHVAIIMDGNRRYGTARHGNALQGHADGGQTLVDCVQWCLEAGVGALTVYAFSTENWARPQAEVDLLMSIFIKYAARCEKEALKNNLVVRVLATERERLPPAVLDALARLEANTAAHAAAQLAKTVASGSPPSPPSSEKEPFVLNLCISYGARGDIVRAARRCCDDVVNGELLPEQVDETTFAQRLSSSLWQPVFEAGVADIGNGSSSSSSRSSSSGVDSIGDPDVLIRTSGEQRLSNFLLFECAYTELFFLEKNWPELTKDDLVEVLREYENRTRRYGK